MSILDDLNANILSNIPCLLGDKVKQIYWMTKVDEDELKVTQKSLKQKTSERLLSIGADQQRYSNIKSNMQLNMAMGTNNSSDSLEEAMENAD